MRRTARLLTGTTGAALAVAAAGLLATPAYAGEAPARRPPVCGCTPRPSPRARRSRRTPRRAAREDTAAGDATAVGAGRFALAPSTYEGEAIGQFQVPPSAQPGTYEIVAACAGSGRRVTGDLVVTLTPDAEQVVPEEA